eukprot:TRINITY_DN4615_c0_g1_i2.p1 TRINITY_DN4615_c0_g1~~TRINITY_DN4615_c0_g1_i2.p1  ORF type:complete len:368 (+),score=63.49 TRINITY_DN4615_c0_g1_i2:35-1138(+)
MSGFSTFGLSMIEKNSSKKKKDKKFGMKRRQSKPNKEELWTIEPSFDVAVMLNPRHSPTISSSSNPVFVATETGDFKRLKELLECDIDVLDDVNSPDQSGKYLVHIAAQNSREDIINLLIDHGADINVVEEDTDWNILHFAAIGGSEKLFNYLVTHPDMEVYDHPNQDRNTPIHYFCRQFMEDSYNTIHEFVQRGVNINAQNFNGETPLHNACWKGNHTIVKSLLLYGVDINLQNDHGETPLHWAARNGSERIVRMLLNAGGRPDIVGASGTPYEVAMPIDTIKRILMSGRRAETRIALRIRVSRLSMIQKREIEAFRWEINFHEVQIERQVREVDHCTTFVGQWRGMDVCVSCIIISPYFIRFPLI